VEEAHTPNSWKGLTVLASVLFQALTFKLLVQIMLSIA